MSDLSEWGVCDPEILGGRAVFRGSIVPIETLLENLEDGLRLPEILDSTPSIPKSSNALGRAIMSPLILGTTRFLLDHEVILVSTPSRGHAPGPFSVSRDSWGWPDGAGKSSSRIS